MDSFATIDLTSFRQDIASGNELDRHGHRIKECAKGSVGRFIKDRRSTKERGEFPNILNIPQSRCKEAINDMTTNPNQSIGMWDRSKTNKLIENSDDVEDKGNIQLWKDDPIRFDELYRKRLPGNEKNVRRLTNSSKSKTNVQFFLEMMHENMIKRMMENKIPPFVVGALSLFTTSENISAVFQKANCLALLESESLKLNSDLIPIIIGCFENAAREIVNKYHRLLQSARQLGGMSDEDLQWNNQKGFSINVRPIPPDVKRSLHPADERNLEKDIYQYANNALESRLLKYVADINAQNTILAEMKTPQPSGGTKFVTMQRKNENKKHERRQWQRLKKGDDPMALFDFDPDSIRHPDIPVMMPESSFEYLLPKRHRDVLMEKMNIK